MQLPLDQDCVMAPCKPQRQPSLALRIATSGLALALLAGTATQSCSLRRQAAPPFQGMGPGWMWGGRRGPVDQHFMVMMVAHHEAAIAMADLAQSRARRPEIRELARSINASQARENEQMRRWYRQWYGRDLPSWSGGSGWGWRHGGMMGSPGMGGGPGSTGSIAISLEALKKAADFDKVFLEQMIPHHQMGVMMATMETFNTERPELKQLAEEMIRTQGEEIKTMQGWHRSWYQ